MRVRICHRRRMCALCSNIFFVVHVCPDEFDFICKRLHIFYIDACHRSHILQRTHNVKGGGRGGVVLVVPKRSKRYVRSYLWYLVCVMCNTRPTECRHCHRRGIAACQN